MRSAETDTPDAANMYWNTIGFSIVSALIIIALLAMLLNERMSASLKGFAPFIITVQIGLVLVVIYALYKTVLYEHGFKKYNDRMYSKTRRAHILSCPDYWTLKEDGTGSRICERKYTIPGKADYIQMQGATNTINMKDYDMQPMDKACTALSTKLKTSWSDLKAECDAYKF
jgi:hypothetical protein